MNDFWSNDLVEATAGASGKMLRRRENRRGLGLAARENKKLLVLIAFLFAFSSAASAQTLVTGTFLTQGTKTPAQAGLDPLTTIGSTAVYGDVQFVAVDMNGARLSEITCGSSTFAPQPVVGWIKSDGTLMASDASAGVTLAPTLGCNPTGLAYKVTVFLNGSAANHLQPASFVQFKAIPQNSPVDWSTLSNAILAPSANLFVTENEGNILDYLEFTATNAPGQPTLASHARLYIDSSTNRLSCITTSGANCSPSGGSGGALLQVNGVSLGSQSVQNFVDTSSIAFTNPSLGILNATIKSASVVDAMLANAYGGVGNCGAHQFENGSSRNAAPNCAQVGFSDLSGTASPGQLPNPSATTLGGIESLPVASNLWIDSISILGIPHASQVGFSNLSGNPTAQQLGTGTPTSAKFLHGDLSWGILVAGDIPALPSSIITSGTFIDSFLASAYSGTGACGSHNWVSTLNRNSGPACTQPNFADLAGSLPLGQTVLTTAGDLLFANATPALARLGIGTSGQCLLVASGLPAWGSCGGGSSNHNLLSVTHPDTTAGTVVRGDIITGQGVSPTWTRLAIGSAGKFVRSDGTDVSWQLLVAADIPSLAASKITSGVLPETVGGTNQSTYTLGDLIYSSAANTLSKLAGNTTGTRKFLRQTGTGSVSAAPAWDTLVAGDIPSLAASAITSGTFADTFLASSYSGIGACGTHNWVSTLNHNAAPGCTRPDYSDLTGVPTPAVVSRVFAGTSGDTITPIFGTDLGMDIIFTSSSAVSESLAAPTFNGSYFSVDLNGNGPVTFTPAAGQVRLGGGTLASSLTLTGSAGANSVSCYAKSPDGTNYEFNCHENFAAPIILAATTTATSQQFFTAYNASTGAFTKAQPNFTDLAGSLALGQTVLTTAGDLLFANATPALARLGIGTSGQCLLVASGLPAWGSCGGGSSNHNLLSTTHPDTTAGTVVRGDIITGQGGTPTWTRLAIGSAGKFVRSDGTDVSWQLLVAADIPSLAASKITSGVLPETVGGTNQSTYTLGDLLYSSAANTLSKLAGNTAATNKLLCQTGTGSVSAAPSWCTLVAGDIPSLAASKITSGTFPETVGGTNQSTYTLGDLIYSSAANTLSKLAGNTTGTRKFLRQTGTGSVSAAPAWDTLVAGDIPALAASAITSGTFSATLIPNPSASTLGGIESLASVANKWINAISILGVPSATQPDFTNLSGTIGCGQLAALTGDVSTSSCAATIAANAVTSAKMAVVNTRRNCDFAIGDTSGSAITNAQLGPQKFGCYVPFAATIVEMDVAADGGTPNVIVAVNHAGTNSNIVSSALATAASGARACSKTSAVAGIDGTTCSATLQNTSIAAGDYLELVSGTAGGTAKWMTIHIVYTVN